MKKVLVLGCNDVTKVIVPELCRGDNDITDICIASKDKAESNEYRAKFAGGRVRIMTAGVDVTNKEASMMMVRIFGPELIVNLLPAEFSLDVMNIALEIGASYIDGALVPDPSGTLLSKQFELFGDFRSKKLTAVVGCSYNPAVITSVVRRALKTSLDTISSVDVLEVGTASEFSEYKDPLGLGSGKEKVEDAVCLENGKPVTKKALSVKTTRTLPGSEEKTFYMMSNKIVDDFIKEIPDIGNVRYFSPYTKGNGSRDDKLIKALEEAGLFSEEPVEINGVKITPKEFLMKMMPAERRQTKPHGLTGTGIIVSGKRGGNDRTALHFAAADNDECMEKHGMYVDSYLDATAMLAGVKLMVNGRWNKLGVFTPCAFEPEMLLDTIKEGGFEYSETRDAEPVKLN